VRTESGAAGAGERPAGGRRPERATNQPGARGNARASDKTTAPCRSCKRLRAEGNRDSGGPRENDETQQHRGHRDEKAQVEGTAGAKQATNGPRARQRLGRAGNGGSADRATAKQVAARAKKCAASKRSMHRAGITGDRDSGRPKPVNNGAPPGSIAAVIKDSSARAAGCELSPRHGGAPQDCSGTARRPEVAKQRRGALRGEGIRATSAGRSPREPR